ncbi:mechanosensitive ion channel family protein [Brachybacterium sp. J144]|uniref:mechanosensitive ion channel family protein n=1 Tax=Brachybacterium sp. J144 TaxID=3116487 RepID=UPI002E774684|nr:mechanosensitive ion channel family protein [Brachybacterium sp. J144]MEE1649313.1 mechanosensitive ion channel family protein [Brachybacterium sp. J144]
MPDLTPLLSAPSADEALTVMDSLLRWLVTSGVRIIVVLVAAAVVSGVVSWLLRRFFRTMADSSARLSSVTGAVVRRDARAQKAAQARREQRAETLSNVARNVARMVIWAVALVMVLSELGVNIAPVIASLGVIGLAAGIGAQTIIKDIVAGIVMLFEDIVAVGDYVDLEYAEGTVEGINLRVTQVRGMDGALWTVRNGEIIRIGNRSRGFSNAVVTLDIDASADDEQVTAVLEQVTAELAADETWKPVILGPADVSGMLGVDGTRYQRRVIVQTAPGEQWALERELRGRIRTAFASADIAFAVPRFVDAVKPA